MLFKYKRSCLYRLEFKLDGIYKIKITPSRLNTLTLSYEKHPVMTLFDLNYKDFNYQIYSYDRSL